MDIQQVSAVTLAVRDMAQSVAFYDAIGFERLYGGEDAAFTSYRLGGTFLNLILTPAYHGQWWGRVIFRVAQVDELHAAVVARGIEAEVPRNGSWGERYFHLKDPDGHELSFAQLLR